MTSKKCKVIICKDQCKGCELCVHSCPKKLLTMSDSLNAAGYRHVEGTEDGCLGCGICFFACPEPGAIKVVCEESGEKN